MSKKTDTIEVRLSPELKARLAEDSAKSGATMSGYVRELIEAGGRSANPKGVPTMKLAQTTLLTALPAAILAAVVFGGAAATATPDLRMAFEEMDRNGDGVVTVEEYGDMLTGELLAPMEGELPAACASDPVFKGMVEEITMSPEQIAAQDLSEMDINGDFKVTYDEMYHVAMRDRAEEFLELDANGDGILIASEMLGVVGEDDTHVEDAEPAADRSDSCITALEADFDAEVEGVDGMSSEQYGRLLLAESDANRDGRVTLQEYLAN